MLFKDPITDTGDKKSARGRMVVLNDGGSLRMVDGLTTDQQAEYATDNLLQPVWANGRFVKRHTLAEIRRRVHG